MRAARAAAAVVAGLTLLGAAACSDDDEPDDEAATTTTTADADAPTTSTDPAATTDTADEAEPEPELLTVLAPFGGDGATDPAAAADAFLARFFPDSSATIGEFRAGDSRSGEVDVVRPREGGGPGLVAATLLVRQLGGSNGWWVTAAVNPNVTIEAPSQGAELPRCPPVTVSGVGRGFEGTLVVRAVDLQSGDVVAEAIGAGGGQAEPRPYAVQLDLGDSCTGLALAIIVAGGTGLDRDTGEFAAIRVNVEV